MAVNGNILDETYACVIFINTKSTLRVGEILIKNGMLYTTNFSKLKIKNKNESKGNKVRPEYKKL